MASLQVREMPDHVYGALKQKAREAHRSLAQQAVVAIAKGLGMDEEAADRRHRVLQDILRNPLVERKRRAGRTARYVREDRER